MTNPELVSYTFAHSWFLVWHFHFSVVSIEDHIKGSEMTVSGLKS